MVEKAAAVAPEGSEFCVPMLRMTPTLQKLAPSPPATQMPLTLVSTYEGQKLDCGALGIVAK